MQLPSKLYIESKLSSGSAAGHELGKCSDSSGHAQVRLATNRNQDMRMNGGRAETQVEYDIGFDDTGRIHALEIQVTIPTVPSAELPLMSRDTLGWLCSVDIINNRSRDRV